MANFLLIFRFGFTGFASPSSFGFPSGVGAGGAIGSKVGKPVATSVNGSAGGVGTTGISGTTGSGVGVGGETGVVSSGISGNGGSPTPPVGWFPCGWLISLFISRLSLAVDIR